MDFPVNQNGCMLCKNNVVNQNNTLPVNLLLFLLLSPPVVALSNYRRQQSVTLYKLDILVFSVSPILYSIQ